jgi:hypothetical protein
MIPRPLYVDWSLFLRMDGCIIDYQLLVFHHPCRISHHLTSNDNLYQWSTVVFSPIQPVKGQTKSQRPGEQHDAPVHVDGVNGETRGPETEERRNDAPYGAESVDGDAESVETPWTPLDSGAGLGGAYTSEQYQNGGREVSGEKSRHCERDEGIEGCGGADVDQS